MEDEQTEQTNQSLEQAIGVVRRRFPWIIVCLVLVGGAAFAYSKRETKKYTATASVAFSSNPLSQQIAGLSPTSSGVTAAAQQQSNLELVRVGDMASTTASRLGRGITAEEVDASLSTSGRAESNIVDISATSTSPLLAAAIANTYTRQFVKEQQRTNRKFFKSALVSVKRQLAALTPAQRFGTDGLNLQNREQSLSLLSELGYSNAQIAQEALVPSSPSSPNTKKDTIVGAVVGLLLGLSLAFLFERFDRRIREPEELEAIYRLPMLGIVPKSATLGGKDAALPPAEAEAFNLIRAHLRFFNIDRDLRTLVIASPASGDGKTTVARHLAEAAARLGSRVLLLEVDLRHPTLGQQLEIQPGPGLAGTLIGAIPVDEATQSVGLDVSPGEGARGRTLDVLAAGAVLPPNPGELLESRAMDALLDRARSTYDLVVIDTPPLTAVSDAFPLLTKVDGVVLVGRIGHSRRDAAERLHQVLASSGAPLLGVIANGAKSSGVGSYATPAGGTSSSGGASGSRVSSSEELAPTAQV
ncbi:MAG: polysaccharide biosynthesis tyrosine autokinase [Solirubrobacteraceae bacterium]